MSKIADHRLHMKLKGTLYVPRDPNYRAGFKAMIHKVERRYEGGSSIVHYWCGGQLLRDELEDFEKVYEALVHARDREVV